jgi:hypothetical protein
LKQGKVHIGDVRSAARTGTHGEESTGRKSPFTRAAVLASGLAILAALPGCTPKGGAKRDTGEKARQDSELRDTAGVEYIPADTGRRDTGSEQDTGSGCAGEETTIRVILYQGEAVLLGTSRHTWRLDDITYVGDGIYTHNSVVDPNNTTIGGITIEVGLTGSMTLPVSPNVTLTVTATINQAAPGYTLGAKWEDVSLNACTVRD